MPNTSAKFHIVPILLRWLLSTIVWTCKFRYHNRAQFDQYLSTNQPFIVMLWHDCSTIAGWAMRNHPVTVMVSDSRDGEYVARLANALGIPTLRGSTSKGAEQALMQAMRLLRKNQPLAITPDGPRGPRYQLQHGGLWLAASTNVPIMHMHIKATREWQLKSWDQHRFPKPFSTIHVSFSAPWTIERQAMDNDLDEVVESVQNKMARHVHETESI